MKAPRQAERSLASEREPVGKKGEMWRKAGEAVRWNGLQRG